MKTFWTYPSIGGFEEEAVQKVIRSGWLTQGQITKQFEDAISAYSQTKACAVLNNGTSGIIATLLALNIGKGDQVIVPDYTFAATANAVLAVGAEPVIVDVAKDYNIDTEKLEEHITRKTKAVLCVDVAGLPCDLAKLREIVDDHGLYLIEDAAEALGATYQGKPIGGKWSDATVFSFHVSKIVTTGEGGAVVSDEPALIERIKTIAKQANVGTVHYTYAGFGLNFKITDLQSAIGLCQMSRIKRFLESRRKIHEFYVSQLKSYGLEFQCESYKLPDKESACWITQVIFENTVQRDKVLIHLTESGCDVKVCWRPLHQVEHLGKYVEEKGFEDSLSIATSLFNKTISLPTGNAMPLDHAKYICDKIVEGLANGN
jgi:dTDP-4-amino-4,6-dideoxygalactose transaminase